MADDRDHEGWRLPQDDDAEYGWGPGRGRTVYFADGRPQGLGWSPSASDGVASLAGRYAAAMALAHERMTGDRRFRPLVEEQLGWPLGRNPWGTSLFTGWPEPGPDPAGPHLPTTSLTGW